MNFEITNEYIEQLKELIELNDEQRVAELIAELHPADIAEIYDELNLEEARFLYLLLDPEIAADVLVELEEDDREKIIKALPSEVIARQFIDNMDSDDAADVISMLSEEKKQEVLLHIEDVEQAGDIVDLLHYDENSAGGIMAKELIKVNENWTVLTCIAEMRKQAEEVDEVYYVYVVDDDNVLKGTLSVKTLITSNDSVKIKTIYNEDVIKVTVDTPGEEVANKMQKYDLVAIPVIDAIGRLAGRITIDDAMELLREEAEKDYQMISGISQDVESTDTVWLLTKARLPWLLIGLFGGILGAMVMGSHESQLAKFPQMVFFVPLIAAMGGNVGVQSSSIIVQSIANNTLGRESMGRKLLKELGVAALNGTVLSSLIVLYNYLFSDSYALTISVSISLFSVILFAAMFGTFVPLILNKLKIDPALATGPFITTVNDIMGLVIYLSIGRTIFYYLI